MKKFFLSIFSLALFIMVPLSAQAEVVSTNFEVELTKEVHEDYVRLDWNNDACENGFDGYLVLKSIDNLVMDLNSPYAIEKCSKSGDNSFHNAMNLPEGRHSWMVVSYIEDYELQDGETVDMLYGPVSNKVFSTIIGSTGIFPFKIDWGNL